MNKATQPPLRSISPSDRGFVPLDLDWPTYVTPATQDGQSAFVAMRPYKLADGFRAPTLFVVALPTAYQTNVLCERLHAMWRARFAMSELVQATKSGDEQQVLVCAMKLAEVMEGGAR